MSKKRLKRNTFEKYIDPTTLKKQFNLKVLADISLNLGDAIKEMCSI